MDSKLQNRRRFTRVPCAAKVIVRTEGGAQSLGRLTDLGIGGVGVLAQGGPLEPGTVVEVTPVVQAAEWPPARYVVRWCRESDEPGWTHLGLGFPGSILDFMNSWIPSLFIGLDFGQKQLLERREHIRVEILGQGILKDPEGSRGEAQVLNLSTGGALLRSREHWEPQTAYEMELCLISGERITLTAHLVGAQKSQEHWLYRVSFDGSEPGELDSLAATMAGLLGTTLYSL